MIQYTLSIFVIESLVPLLSIAHFVIWCNQRTFFNPVQRGFLETKMKKVAIFIDWENLRKEIGHCQKYNKASRKVINYNNIDDIAALIQKPLQKDEEIYRIFYYTAEPLSLEWELKNNKDDKIKKSLQNLKDSSPEKWDKMERINHMVSENTKYIAFKDFFAIRLGKIKMHVDDDKRLMINQKQVDMLLGLDIAHVSYQRLVDRILVFCKDTDIIPALKCARINGLQVCLAHIKEGYVIAAEMKKHVDMIREISLLE